MTSTRALLLAFLAAACPVAAQQLADRGAEATRATRVNERIAALRQEADDLARQARTLLGDLRKLEIERDLRNEEARQADADAADAERRLEAASARLSELEAERVAQLPQLKAQLVDLYKHGRGSRAQMLLGASSLKEFARAARAVSALAAMDERRIEEHRQTIEAMRQERATMEAEARTLEERRGLARAAREAANRAVEAHNALIVEIDARRDLTAQYTGELQQVYERLQQEIAGLSGADSERVPVPIAPFRGGLAWPVTGRVTGAFGHATSRLGGTAVRNGIEIAAPLGTSVRAIHGGTVGYADVFTGLGNLVIIDHGRNNYSLYGYLEGASVQRGDVVSEGTELGRVGSSPAGPPALYFEMRIDGRSVDPVQWLEPR